MARIDERNRAVDRPAGYGDVVRVTPKRADANRARFEIRDLDHVAEIVVAPDLQRRVSAELAASSIVLICTCIIAKPGQPPAVSETMFRCELST
jgi:hypothetical protein